MSFRWSDIARRFKAKPTLTDADPANRVQALAALPLKDAESCQAQLTEIAVLDPDVSVRSAALALVTQDNLLLAMLSPDHNLTRNQHSSIVRHLAARADADSSSAAATHPMVIAERVRTASKDGRNNTVTELLAAIDDQEVLINLGLDANDDLRQHVLDMPLLRGEAGFIAVERGSRSRNKAVNRYARDQLEQLRAERRTLDAAIARMQELTQAVARDPVVASASPAARVIHHQRLVQLRDQFHAVSQSAADSLQRLRAHGEPASDTLPPDPFVALNVTIEEFNDAPFAELATSWRALTDRLTAGEWNDNIVRERAELSEAWLQLADRHPPQPFDHDAFERASHVFVLAKTAHEELAACRWPGPREKHSIDDTNPGKAIHALTRWLKTHDKVAASLRWPSSISEPAIISEQRALREKMAAELARLERVADAAQQSLLEHIQTTEQNIEQGHLDAARSSIAAARRLAGTGDRKIEQTLAGLSSRIKEMADWQTFATSPKRESLCDAMQAIATTPLAAEDQAARVKTLRSEWNALGRITNAAEAKLADRFNASAEIAFGPVREHYKVQAAERKENLARRKEICAQLEQYVSATDFAQADVNAAESIMREARREYREAHPVDRAATSATDKQFETLQASLFEEVKKHWDHNVTEKEAIVAAARALSEGDVDPRDAAEQAKDLQHRWRQVGPTPRRPDQTLWREFRTACDQIFTQRESAFDAARTAASETHTAVTALADEFAASVESAPAAELSPGIERSFRERLSAFGRLEDHTQKMASARFNDIARQLEARLASKAEVRALDAIDEWRTWDQAATAAENGGAEFAAPNEIFRNRQANTEPVSLDDLRTLAIDAEIWADMPSPTEDREARLAHQVNLMNQGLTSRARPEAIELVQRWCATGPKPSECDHLRERLFSAIAKF